MVADKDRFVWREAKHPISCHEEKWTQQMDIFTAQNLIGILATVFLVWRSVEHLESDHGLVLHRDLKQAETQGCQNKQQFPPLANSVCSVGTPLAKWGGSLAQ